MEREKRRNEEASEECFVAALLAYQDNGPGYPPEVLAQERSNIGLKLIKELVG